MLTSLLTVASLVGGGPDTLQYAVKFVCGPGEARTVARGAYFTVINVHNPAVSDSAHFRWKVAGTSGIQRFTSVTALPPDGFDAIRCQAILAQASAAGFLEGFVVLEAFRDLDVVAVLTAAAEGRVVTMDVERITPRPSP